MMKLAYIVIIGIFFSFIGCSNEVSLDGENNSPVVYLAVTRSQAADTESINEDTEDYEDRVHDLAMLVFDSSTGARVGYYSDPNIEADETEKTFTIKLTPGQRDFYFVANMPMAAFETITTKSAMETYMNTFSDLDINLYQSATESKGFPMSRVYLNQPITEGGSMYSPTQFKPNGETKIKLIRAVAKLEVQIDGSTEWIKSIYYKNAYRKFSLSSEADPGSVSYYEDKPLLKKGNSYLYYMPEAVMTSPVWSASSDHKPINYFLIESQSGTKYEIPIISDNRIIAGTDYLAFATGANTEKPDYKIYRNRHYIYRIKEQQTIGIIYDIEQWTVKKTSTYMGYGYNVNVDEDGNVTVSNTIDVCAPHKVTLKTISPFEFSDGTTEKELTSLDTNASIEHLLNKIPQSGDGVYLEIYYNDTLVKSFSK